MHKAKTTERGWGAHYICASSCLFRRNTLVEYKDIKIVVSSVGARRLDNGDFREIAPGRHYETMAFHTKKEDTRYHDIDVTRSVDFSSNWQIAKLDADDEANIMHDKVVKEICDSIRR